MPMLLTRMSTAGTCRMSLAQPSAVERSTGAACSCAFGTARLILSIASATEASLRPLTTTPALAVAREDYLLAVVRLTDGDAKKHRARRLAFGGFRNDGSEPDVGAKPLTRVGRRRCGTQLRGLPLRSGNGCLGKNAGAAED